jgi:threonine aldolase
MVETSDGILTWKAIVPYLRKATPHMAPTAVIAIENTHNMQGGVVYPLKTIYEICDHAHELGIKVHMDGARLFNASTASGVPVDEIAAKVDTVMFCLSKGLGAPVGSMVVGSQKVIDDARLYRKRLGGAMRQVGILAAAGLISLEEMPKRLHEDHANAKFLAESLRGTPSLRVSLEKTQTNIVIVDVSELGVTSGEFSARLKAAGVLMNPSNEKGVRAVTHYDVTRKDCEIAAGLIQEVAAGRAAAV